MRVPRSQSRRRKSARCPGCKEWFKIPPRGRPPAFCSRSCRQRAYEQRKWSKPHPVELLARDIATASVHDLVQQVVWEVLLEAGIVSLPSPPPKPKSSGPPLRLIEK